VTARGPARPLRIWDHAEWITRLRPVDRVVAAYNLLLAFVWLGAWWSIPQRAGAGWVVAALHFVLAALPWLVDTRRGRVTARLASLLGLMADLYPLLVLVGTWAELGPLIALLYRHYYDLIDLWLDQMVFGTHWHLRWIADMPWPWLAEVMYGAYFSLYPVLIGVPLVLLALRQRSALRDYVFSVTLTHLICFAIYLSFPVLGPWQFGSHGVMPHNIFYTLSTAVQQAGDSLGTACPSTHVAGSATIAFVAWRRFPRAIALALVVDAVLIALATVYTQNHYAFDALTGFVVVLLVQGAVIPLLEGRRLVIPRWPVLEARPTHTSPLPAGE
jgi:membrane-associated phospholipid phosphatase